MSSKTFELVIRNETWIPESMGFMITTFIADFAIEYIDEKLKLSYNFSWNSNDQYEHYIKDNINKLSIDIDNALNSMVEDYVKEVVDE